MPSALTEAKLQALLEAAHTVAQNAYAPYSHFRVGAALLLAESNAIVTGCNIENASFRLTMCAEQTAVAAAVAQYGPQIRIQVVAIVNLNATASHPCGACRQTLVEFSLPDTLILFPGPGETPERRLLADLLPAAFTL